MKLSESEKEGVNGVGEVDSPYIFKIRIPFPNELYAESAMKAIGVDPPFLDSKTRKTTIRREMTIEVLNDKKAYLNIVL